MRFKLAESVWQNPKETHRVFLWWPTRINRDEIAWLEFAERHLVVDDEGCWAGGYRAHWEYAD